MDITAFPMEVLTFIVMLVSDETELSKLSFIKRNTVKNATNKNLTLISPKTRCILHEYGLSERFLDSLLQVPSLLNRWISDEDA